MSRFEIALSIDDPAWDGALAEPAIVIERAARAALDAGGAGDLGACLELSVVLTDDEQVRALNRAWRAKDSATNVLSFPSLDDDDTPPPDGAPVLLGDVILAFGTCATEAEASAIALADHVSHLVVHGVLHVLGFDHETDDDAAAMEALETAILGGLGIADPYQGELE